MAEQQHDEETTAESSPPAPERSVQTPDSPTEPEPEPEGTAESGAEPGAEPDAETGPDAGPGSEPESEPTPESRPEPEPAPQPEPAPAGKPATESAGKSAAPRRSGVVRRRILAGIGILGELLITAGLVLALFVVYSLWWTNVLADRDAKRESEAVRESWAQDKDTGPGALDTKDGIGFLHVPSMSDDVTLVTKGTDLKDLNRGVAGYYTKPVESALPQDPSGNFSLAAHRDGHGAKFHNIDKIGNGDPIVFETKNTWYVYTVYKTLPETSKYNVDVLDPVPEESGKTEKGRYITLTTCTPVYTSTHRYIVWGELERTEKVDADRTPPEELR